MKLKLDFAEKGKVYMNEHKQTIYQLSSGFPLNSANFQAPIHLSKYFEKQQTGSAN